ncbi:hypothetical protein BASA81_012592 [Batrachochytrium salamandrivorans]|nr:hypothetical protein BASA81_012592 [Batrachochytrium salamandrivorans]
MKAMFWLLLGVLSLLSQSQASPVRYPMDLYLLADSSKSISKANWRLIANFADNLQATMAEYALGYYQNQTVDGLRVSILAFHCARGTDTKRYVDFVTGPTGNVTKIRNAITAMKKVVPAGETCASGGLQLFFNEITASRQALNVSRPSAVVLLTDGVLTADDLGRTTSEAGKLQTLETTETFLINYGGGANVMRQWGNILGTDKNIFQSTDLDQLVQVITALMLGNLQVVFSPNTQQQIELAQYPAPNNLTVCGKSSNNSARFFVEGKVTTLFQLEQIRCSITINQTTQITTMPYRVNDSMYCDAPLTAVQGRTNFAVSMYVLVEGVQKSLFAPVDVVVSTMLCISAKSLVLGGGCFPGTDSVQQNTLLAYGPSIEYSTAPNPYSCRFDSSAVVGAAYNAELGGYVCVAPSLDIENALLLGVSPSPFKTFTLLQGAELKPVLTSSAEMVNAQQACVNSVDLTPVLDEVCWEDAAVTGHQLVPVFAGESLDKLIGSFSPLEMSCLLNGKTTVSATLVPNSNQVQCNVDGTVWSLLLPRYQSGSATKLTVGIQVRHPVENEAPNARGWWLLKTLDVVLPKVSPCLEYTMSTTCLGQTAVVQFTGTGLANFIVPGAFACRMNGVDSPISPDGTCAVSVLRKQTVQLVSTQRGLTFGLPQTQPAFTACLQVDDGYAQSHCFSREDDEDNSARDEMVLIGPSAEYLANSVSGLFCAYSFGSPEQAVVQTPVSWNGTALACAIPSWRPATVTLPFTTSFRLSVTDSARVELGNFNPQQFPYRLDACFAIRQPRCLERMLRITFQGEGNVTGCEFTGIGGRRNRTGPECAVENWFPTAGLETRYQFVTVYAADSAVALLTNVSIISPLPVCVSVTAPKSVAVGTALPTLAMQGQTLTSAASVLDLVCELNGLQVPAVKNGSAVSCTFPQPLYDPLENPQFTILMVAPPGRRRRRLQSTGNVLYSIALGNVSIDASAALGSFAGLTSAPCYDYSYTQYSTVGGGPECQVLALGTTWQSCKQTYVGSESTLPYRIVLTRKDNNQTLVLSSGTVNVCPKTSLRTNAPTLSPTLSPTAAGLVPVDTNAAAVLSGGAIAGIVIGILAFFCLLLLLVVCCRRRRRQEDKGSQQAREEAEEKQKAREQEEVLLQPEEESPSRMMEHVEVDKENSPILTAQVVDPPQVIVKGSTNNDEVVFIDLPPKRKAPTTNDEPMVQVIAPTSTAPAKYVEPIPPAPPVVLPSTATGTGFEFKSGDLVERFDPDLQSWNEVSVVTSQVDADVVTLAGGVVVERHLVRRLDTAFQVGENVEELGRDGEWRPAQVTSQRNASQYTVDGPGGSNMIRTQNQSLRFPQYRGGDLLECKQLGTSQQWKKFTVVGLEPNGIVVGLEDGEVDPRRIPNRLVRRRIQPSAPVAAVANVGAAANVIALPKHTRALLDFEELPDFCFQITVDKSRGLGVRLGWTKNSEIVVQSFLTLVGVGAGPLEESERVNLGDQVLAVNGTSVGGKSFAEVSDMIRQSPDRIKLKFGRWADTLRMRVDLAVV